MVFESIQRDFAAQFTARRTARSEVADDLDRLSYRVYLSQPHAARSGGVYFCGLKPYGTPHRRYAAPRLPHELPDDYNHYRDDPGTSPFYATARRVLRWGLDQTHGADVPLEGAFCTNWCFARAADTAHLKRCGWTLLDFTPHHRTLLRHLQPKLVLCAGNGPFSAFAGMLELHETAPLETLPAEGHARIKLARTDGRILIGFPHFSRYSISDAQLARCADFIVNLPA